MVVYDEIAYSMNIMLLFLMTYAASCTFVDAFYVITCIAMVNTYMTCKTKLYDMYRLAVYCPISFL